MGREREGRMNYAIDIEETVFEGIWYWIGFYKLESGKATTLEISKGKIEIGITTETDDGLGGRAKYWKLVPSLLFRDPAEAIDKLEKNFINCIQELRKELVPPTPKRGGEMRRSEMKKVYKNILFKKGRDLLYHCVMRGRFTNRELGIVEQFDNKQSLLINALHLSSQDLRDIASFLDQLNGEKQ